MLTIHPDARPALAALYDCQAEVCAVMVGTPPLEDGGAPGLVRGFWPVPNVWPEPKPGKGGGADSFFAVAKADLDAALADAAQAGAAVLGLLHTHIYNACGPTVWDLRHLPADTYGAVWHPRSGTFTVFDKRAPLACELYDVPPVLQALANLTLGPGEEQELPATPEPRFALADDAGLVAYAAEIHRALADPALDLEGSGIDPARVAALGAALEAHGA